MKIKELSCMGNFGEQLEEVKSDRYKKDLEEWEKGRMSRLAVERINVGMTSEELSSITGIPVEILKEAEQFPWHSCLDDKAAIKLAKLFGIQDHQVLLPDTPGHNKRG